MAGLSTAEQTELVRRGEVQAVRVHQDTGRNSRLYTLEYTDGVQTWREPLWSVTTLLKALDKPALVYWAAREVAAAAFKDRAHLESDLERFGEREAIYQLSQAPWSRREKAADVGTAVHALIDAHVRGAEAPNLDEDVRDKARRHFDQFRRFEEAYQPEWHGAEMTVVNAKDGWAGTLDELASIGNRGLGLIDVKNTNPAGRKKDQPGVWPEHSLQCAAYAHAEEVVSTRDMWVAPVPMPEVHWGAVLWLAEDRYALVEVDVSDRAYRAFRIAAEMYRWQDGPGKAAVIGERPPAAFGVLPTMDEQAEALRAQGVQVPVINEAQRKRMLKLGANADMDHAAVKALVEEMTGATSTTKVPLAQYEAVCTVLEARATDGAT